MKTFIMTIAVLSLVLYCNAQMRNNNWCFGHYAGIHFDAQNVATTFTSPLISRGSCASISDSAGNLLFSFAYDTACCTFGSAPPELAGKIYDTTGNIMQNGDSLFCAHWYQHTVIVPNPANENKFYTFSAGITSYYGLYYSEIDMSLNNGLGAVTQKNIQLDTLQGIDCLTAIKHGNGRDWWLMYCPTFIPDSSDAFYLYLIDSNGINPPIIQHVGQKIFTNAGSIVFNVKGNQFARSTIYGLLELFDFDRCTGNITSHVIIENQPFLYMYWFLAFSPSGRYLYVCAPNAKVYLYQFDLQAPNIKASRVTLDTSSYPAYSGGWLKLAPDSNIYWTNRFYDGGCGGFPFCDTTYNMYNMNLSVINEPDSPGVACNFTKYSFSLGGNRTYWGLPNNPDYDLPGDSACILANLTPGPSPLREGRIQCTYISAWQKVFINAQNLKGRNVTVSIYDGRGSLMVQEFKSSKVNAGYFSSDVDCGGWSDGLYVVHLQTEKEILSKKFIKE